MEVLPDDGFTPKLDGKTLSALSVPVPFVLGGGMDGIGRRIGISGSCTGVDQSPVLGRK